MLTSSDFDVDYETHWCPGCGNFGILAAMKDALAALNIRPHEILVISGIGQAAKTPHFMKCNYFHSLHGRALPLATGAKVANHDLKIIVNTGDGDCYGEGGNHFMHAIRRNLDVTVLAHNNRVYGLTKGQASPTSDIGMKTKMQPQGVLSDSFNPISVALALGCGFVARGFSGDVAQLSSLIQSGIRHNGFALIDILQPCVSFNPVNTFQWYKKRIRPIQEDHDVSDLNRAFALAQKWGDEIPVGIFYRKETPAFSRRISKLADHRPLVSRSYDPEKVSTILNSF
ncbi:MAG: 2-oxoacid:ferredoxin oxidoreductase subunit beta [Thermodesulfobacteriota bacterium]